MTLNVIETPTITVTVKAVINILNLMVERKLDGQYLRLFVEGIGCSGPQFGLAFSEEPRGDDIVFNSNGICALIDPTSLVFLDGATVDYIDTAEGGNFEIDNPNLTPNSACHSCSKRCE